MNIVVGDKVIWDAPQFKGGSFLRGRSTGKPRFVGTKRFEGLVERESYGTTTGQHTFSVRLVDGKLKRVKGRNLYPNLVRHEPGADHAEQVAAKTTRIELAEQTAGTLSPLPARLRPT